MERIWTLAAAIGVMTAGACFWLGYGDAAFVAVVLGCVAWFLGYRSGIKKPEEDSQR